MTTSLFVQEMSQIGDDSIFERGMQEQLDERIYLHRLTMVHKSKQDWNDVYM